MGGYCVIEIDGIVLQTGVLDTYWVRLLLHRIERGIIVVIENIWVNRRLSFGEKLA